MRKMATASSADGQRRTRETNETEVVLPKKKKKKIAGRPNNSERYTKKKH